MIGAVIAMQSEADILLDLMDVNSSLKVSGKTVYSSFHGDWSKAASYSDFGSDNSARNHKAAWGRIMYKKGLL